MKHVTSAFAIACMLAAMARPQSTQPAKTYRISGVMLNGATGQRLSRVNIVMTPAGGSKETATTSGTDGRFAFESLPAGQWSLHAERKGFARQAYGERPGAPNTSSYVVTGPDGASEDLSFRLDPPAVISGKITDEAGEPVAAALQVIIQLQTGRRQFMRIKDAATDEQGDYRIWDLPAVPCYLLVVTPTPPATASDQPPATFAPQYYRNATDPRAATMLDLKPGEEYKADFVLRRVRGVSIHMTGEIGSSGIMLSAEGPGGAEVILAQLDPGQSGSFYNIAPGHYKLTLYDMVRGTQSSKRIEVGAGDLTVEAPFPDPVTVTVKVRLVDGDGALPQNVTVLLHADGDYQTFARVLGPDGSATIPGLTSGRYKFMLAVGGLYIQNITSENVRVVDGIVDVPETGAVKLDVRVAAGGGQVIGKVRANGKPVPAALVVLAPRADSTNSVDYHAYQTESDGSFHYTAIKPGDYVLFATTDRQLEYGNPAAIRKQLAAGRPVRVEPKGLVDGLQIEPLRP